MKKYLAFLTLFSAFTAHACPTCIGRMKKKSPPFFSDESYQPGQNDPQEQSNVQENKDDQANNKGEKQ